MTKPLTSSETKVLDCLKDRAGNVDRMIAKDEDGGKKLRGRAGQYDPLTRAYLEVLGFKP